MNFTSHDVIIIERALRTAMKHESEEQRSRDYQEVLFKMQESANQAFALTTPVSSEVLDGIRYDYDDSADLM
ncbi:hypothetical protein [Paenibacillus roseipurpureus]|uniref:Uncharacterized protein n=1 Tax=Paenibacillus roseopurpureus TaxID=2918901 RepID=A0AA96LM49_9BACL|nr:hypothetical protein [Paenibacillus sp. MBLB1832]WNR42268.1 hypothetical protein MJB10_14090 [Paenibacillus sp. MBLB1832]